MMQHLKGKHVEVASRVGAQEQGGSKTENLLLFFTVKKHNVSLCWRWATLIQLDKQEKFSE